MYDFADIREVHLEISSYCQAKCPMCPRTYHGNIPNPKLVEDNMSLDIYKKIFTTELTNQINVIQMCGNYGDPIFNNDLLNMIEYTVDINPNVKFDIHTNGGARNTVWWEKLAKILPNDHLLFFGIDGLSDTHKLYRIDTDFNKIINNATAFINAGGNAQWVFITFKHNEHQLDQAKQLSKELNFQSFQEKQSSRFIGGPWFDVLDNHGNILYKLEQPSYKKIDFVSKDKMSNFKKILSNSQISCIAKKDSSVYIDSKGIVWPCCYVASSPYLYSTTDELIYEYHAENVQSVNNLLSRFKKSLNIRDHELKDIINSNDWQTIWNESFDSNPTITCAKTCGEITGVTKLAEQFMKLEKFL